MRALVILACVLLATSAQGQSSWILSSPQGRAVAGERFAVVVVAPPGVPLPEEIALRVNTSSSDIIITLQASGPAQDGRRAYGGRVPPAATGAATLTLDELPSNELLLLVAKRDAVEALTTSSHDEAEPPLQENEPMYVVLGMRDGATARFQLSFKYRLFDYGSGFGQERPWLAGFYFAYTQTSTWDLASDSKAFRDTSYRPSLFWKWERTDNQTWINGARVGAEHESNGRDGPRSRSINVLFVQPEWRWRVGGGSLEFAPRFKRYMDKEENPDIEQYRGHVDWKLRYDTGGNWIASTVARTGTAGRGSLQLDLARRTRDLKFGPISGYVYLQYFNGWGEDILDYNVRRNSQIRVGFAIVP
jgi:outer membrane phospholipase A